jgi:Na+-driven multidrug efflux pump
MFIHFIAHSYGAIYVAFLNGIGIIKVQLICAVISSIIFIPLAIVLSTRLNIGIIGIAIALLISHIFQYIVYSIQYNKIIHDKAVGVWIK